MRIPQSRYLLRMFVLPFSKVTVMAKYQLKLQ